MRANRRTSERANGRASGRAGEQADEQGCGRAGGPRSSQPESGHRRRPSSHEKPNHSGRPLFRNKAMIKEIMIRPSYLQCNERLLAAIQLTGVLPKRLLHIEHHHVGLEPKLMAGREFLQILVPSARCDD